MIVIPCLNLEMNIRAASARESIEKKPDFSSLQEATTTVDSSPNRQDQEGSLLIDHSASNG